MSILEQSALSFISQLNAKAGSGKEFSLEQAMANEVAEKQGELEGKLTPVRIAILASHTIDHFLPILKARMVLAGFEAQIYVADFGTIMQSVLDSDADLYVFKPDVVWVFTTHRDLQFSGNGSNDIGDVKLLVDREIKQQIQLVDAIKKRCSAAVVVNNSDIQSSQSSGNYSATASWSFDNFVHQYNLALPDSVADNATVFDFYSVATLFGRKNWIDGRFWHHSKHAFTFDAYGTVAHRFARLVTAIMGRSAKCLVLDLDNTLWGGVIGDDGLEGIEIGNGSGADGEAFLALQSYVKQLRDRGIILAVCSKNEEAAAKSPFLEHPDMLLKLEHFAAFKANWQNKASNLREIAKELNIGVDTLVFLDDNPVERNLVREMLPEVYVPEISDDPSEYVTILDELRLFETLSVGEEDKQRAEYYTANRLRLEEKTDFENIDDYLRSLDMEATVSMVESISHSRAIQLLNKSNQFNLDGTKVSEGEFDHYLKNEKHFAACFRLKDRFGDNGIISVVMFNIDNNILRVDKWVMSCRVLARGMEQVVIDALAEFSSSLGVERIVGHWRRSGRNNLVELLYERLGFELIDSAEDLSEWGIDLANIEKNEIITVVTNI